MKTVLFVQPTDLNCPIVESIGINPLIDDGQPTYRVLVADDSTPKYVLNLYLCEELDYFHELKYSDTHVVIGCGEKVHFFNLKTQRLKSYPLDTYFGHLYSRHALESPHIESEVLVTSATTLYLFSADGELKWTSPELGIDGVIIHDIDGQTIRGAGEYDPPGGWRDFTLQIP